MKTCKKCNSSKGDSAFEKGRNTCKECRYNYSERREYLLNYQKEKRTDLDVVAARKEKRKTYKEAENARNREYYAKNKLNKK